MLLEFTLVRLGWTFSLDLDLFVTQVILAIGVSMVALAGARLSAALGDRRHRPAMIAGHNLLDGIKAEQFGAAAPLWNLLHQPGDAAS